MGNDVYDMILRHKEKYVVSSTWIYKNKCTKKGSWFASKRIEYDMTCSIDQYISPCIEWRRKIILHFRGSDYRRYLSLTRYDMMDNFLMDRDFTKSKVGSNLQSWMQKSRICWWSDKTNSWKMLWWKNTRMMFGI